MTLQAELGAKLDVGALVGGLIGEIRAVAGALEGLELPVEPEAVEAAAGPGLAVRTKGIGEAAARAGGAVAPALAGLSGPAASLERVRAALALFVDVAGQEPDSATRVRELAGRLGGTLEGEGSFIARLQAFARVLGEAPEGRTLEELVLRAVRAAGVEVAIDKGPVGGLVPAVAAALDVVGGVMALETMLAEAERLGGVLRERLDPGVVARRVDGLVAALSGGTGSLAARLRTLDVGDAAAVAEVEAAVRAARVELAALAGLMTEGMAFGEATLVYLDLPALRAQLTAAAGQVRETALEPLEATLAGLVGQLGPLLAVDLRGAPPAQSLEALLAEFEGRVEEIADDLRTFDVASTLSGPIAATAGEVSDVAGGLAGAIEEANLAVTGALGEVRDVARALPFDDVATELRRVLEPVREALEALGELLGAIEAAIGATLAAAQVQLDRAETALDDFETAAGEAFAEAAEVLDPAKIDRVVGAVSDNVRAFADVIAKAQMQPYFDTAVGAIDTTTGVIEKVPFALLPDSMEADVVVALRPIKEADAAALKVEIEALLEIGPDGRIAVRERLEGAIAEVQEKYDALIKALEDLDPRGRLTAIDAELQRLGAGIAAVEPSLDLKPVREALDQLKAAVGSLDLDAALAPLGDGFDLILERIESFSPDVLIGPLEQELDRAREAALELARLREWSPALQEIRDRAAEGLALVDPTLVRGQIEGALREAVALLDPATPAGPAPSAAFGAFVLDLLAGSGLKLHAPAFESVLGWLQGGGGAAALEARSGRLADAIASTREAVTAVDPAAISARLAAAVAEVRGAVVVLPAGDARLRLEVAVGGLAPVPVLAPMVPNRAQYLGLLEQASAAVEDIRRTGHSEVDIALQRLAAAVSPLAPVTRLLRDVLAQIGVTGLHEGIRPVLQRVFAAVPPERLAGLVAPIVEALHARAQALIDGVIDPVQSAIDDLVAAVDALDLAPLREAVAGVQQEVRDEVAALDPEAVLGDVLAAFRTAQDEVRAFDPLSAIEAALDRFSETAGRVVARLSAEKLLAKPLELYDELLAALDRLDLEALLAPLLDQLEAIVQQVSDGLGRTVDAFERLQDALPARVGSTPLSGSASVSVG